MKVIIVNGKKPSVEAVKKVLETNPNARPVFIDLGKAAAMKFVKSFGFTGNCTFFRGLNKTSHEQRLNLIIGDKRVEVVETIGEEKTANVTEKKEKIYKTAKEAEKACADFTDYVTANYKEISDNFGWGDMFNETKVKKLAMKMGATSVRYFERTAISKVYFQSETGRSYFVELR